MNDAARPVASACTSLRKATPWKASYPRNELHGSPPAALLDPVPPPPHGRHAAPWCVRRVAPRGSDQDHRSVAHLRPGTRGRCPHPVHVCRCRRRPMAWPEQPHAFAVMQDEARRVGASPAGVACRAAVETGRRLRALLRRSRAAAPPHSEPEHRRTCGPVVLKSCPACSTVSRPSERHKRASAEPAPGLAGTATLDQPCPGCGGEVSQVSGSWVPQCAYATVARNDRRTAAPRSGSWHIHQ